VERGAPERKQVVMQKAMTLMQQRGLPGAAHTLFALCLSLLLSHAHGAECTSGGSLPCSFGGCEFSKDASGMLDRTGSCPSGGGWLYLNKMGIKGLREGVFDNMGALEGLNLDTNELTTLPATVFNGLTNLRRLILYNDYLPGQETLRYDKMKINDLPETVFHRLTKLEHLAIGGNQLTSVPEKVFNGLTNLRDLDLSSNKLTTLPKTVFDGITSLMTHLHLYNNPDMSCVPLTQERIAAIRYYGGPSVTCQLYCTAGNAGPWSGGSQTCTPCGSGFSPARPCISTTRVRFTHTNHDTLVLRRKVLGGEFWVDFLHRLRRRQVLSRQRFECLHQLHRGHVLGGWCFGLHGCQRARALRLGAA
jgi:hypothetical protein